MFRKAYALDNGESDSIRDNLRLALAKTEKSVMLKCKSKTINWCGAAAATT